MKVTVKDNYLNVRVGKPRLNAPCYQYIAPGSVIEVDGKLYKGDKYGESDIDTWFKDEAGNYYWSGGFSRQGDITEVLNASVPKPKETLSFPWFRRLGVEQVWQKYKEKGNAVTIAVLDTGYDRDNPDIHQAIKAERILIDQQRYPGINLVIDDQSNDGHGSRCASLIAARNKLNWNIGIAPECKLIFGKVSINREMRDFEYIIRGIKWALEQGVDIISISFAVELTAEQAKLYNEKFNALLSGSSVLVFAAAGNAGEGGATGERYPASFSGCTSVGATDEKGNLSVTTVLSANTILHAPGMNIESFSLNNIPSPQSGTSFSTPIVAAIAGLAVSYLKKNGRHAEIKDLVNKLISSAQNLDDTGTKKVVNMERLFSQL